MSQSPVARPAPRSKSSLALAVRLGLAVLLLCVAAAATAQEVQRGGTVTMGTFRDATDFDPYGAGGTQNSWLLGNIYDSLLTYSAEGEFEQGLATAWQYEDPLTLTLTLREGVRFQDGTSFGPEDVVATVEKLRSPDTAGSVRARAQNVDSIEVLDDHTVRFHLKAPDSTLLHSLAGTGWLVVSADDVAAGFDFKTRTNGTGPFVLQGWEPERQYVLEANPDYWVEGLPYLDTFIIQIIPDDRARVDALRSGLIDIADYIPWQDVLTLESDFVVNKWYTMTTFLRVNQNKAPFDDVRVRQALSYILDRQEINDLAFGGQGSPITGPLEPKGSLYYSSELEGTLRKDWDRARELLKEAGYATPADVPPLQMAVSTSAVATQPGLVVQQELQSFGLKVEWVSIDVPTLAQKRKDGNYQLMIDGGSRPSPDPDYLRSFFHSVSGNSHAVSVGYKNEQLDALLDRGNASTDVAERRAIYLEAQEIINEELPVIFLLWRPQADAHAKYVHGYVAHQAGLGSLNPSKAEFIWRGR